MTGIVSNLIILHRNNPSDSPSGSPELTPTIKAKHKDAIPAIIRYPLPYRNERVIFRKKVIGTLIENFTKIKKQF